MLIAWPVGRIMKGGTNPLVPLGCAFGALIPDLSLITQMAINWGHGMRGEDVVSPTSELLTEMSHSLFFWGDIFLIAVVFQIWRSKNLTLQSVFALLVGILGPHILADMATHKGIVFPGADYFWPLRIHLARFGFWTYRFGVNQFLPRWQELAFDASLIAVIMRMEMGSIRRFAAFVRKSVGKFAEVDLAVETSAAD